MEKEFVKKIKDYFDLNIYETKAWLALIQKGVASAREIAEISGIPRSRTYDVLESLEKQGFAIPKVGKPVKFIPVKPTSVLERLKTEIVKSAEEKAIFLDKLKDTKEYEELESLHKCSTENLNKKEMSCAIRGKQNIYNYAREIIKASQDEILICMPASELLERIRFFNFLFQNIKKGVKLNIHLSGTDEEIKKISRKYNLKVEKTALNAKFFIIDNKQILFSLNNPNSAEEESAVWIDSDFFVNSMTKLFNTK